MISYGFIAPIASGLVQIYDADGRYMACMKAGVIAHAQGYAPQVSVEFARKTLAGNIRPSFAEVEEMLQNVGTAE